MVVYGAASNNILTKLDSIHHQGLRIALGAFRTSPVTSLYAKAQEMCLKNRRKKLSMNYVLGPDNPAYSCVFEPPNSKLFEKSSLTPPLGLRILPLFEDSKIDLDVVAHTTLSDTPPWSQSEPQICLSLTKYKKDTTNREVHPDIKIMCRYLPTAQKWMRRLLLQQCRLLPQIAPSHVD